MTRELQTAEQIRLNGPSGNHPAEKFGQQIVVTGQMKVCIGKAGVEQPVIEFRCTLQSKDIPDVERVVE